MTQDKYKAALDDLNNPYTIWKPNESFKRHAIPDKHLEAMREALTLAAENEKLRKEVSELSTKKQGLIGISDGKSDIIKLLEYRIALLETFIESRGYDVPV